jgi:hypothetical protein
MVGAAAGMVFCGSSVPEATRGGAGSGGGIATGALGSTLAREGKPVRAAGGGKAAAAAELGTPRIRLAGTGVAWVTDARGGGGALLAGTASPGARSAGLVSASSSVSLERFTGLG